MRARGDGQGVGCTGGDASASAIRLEAQCSIQASRPAAAGFASALRRASCMPQEQPQGGELLADHGMRLRAARHRPLRRRFGELREVEAILPLIRGGDELRGNIGFGGVGRDEGGDAGDRRVIAAEQIFEFIASGGGRARRVDELPVGVGGLRRRLAAGGRPPGRAGDGAVWGGSGERRTGALMRVGFLDTVSRSGQPPQRSRQDRLLAVPQKGAAARASAAAPEGKLSACRSAQVLRRQRRTRPRPSSPEPSKASEVGSGTCVTEKALPSIELVAKLPEVAKLF